MKELLRTGLLASTIFIAAGAQAEQIDEMKLLMDFENKASAPEWFAMNDGVMGGLSKGSAELKDGALVFSGELSLENNGGFSSIRTEGDFNLAGKTFIVIRLKGDGRNYQLRLAADARYRDSAVSYAADFETKAGEWTEVKVPFAAFSPQWRGKVLEGPPLNLSEVEEIGILIGDKKPGPFSLEVDWIKVG